MALLVQKIEDAIKMDETQADRWIIKNLDNLEKLYKEVSFANVYPFDAVCFFACSEKMRLSCRRQNKGVKANEIKITDIEKFKETDGLSAKVDVCFRTTYVHEGIEKAIKLKKEGNKFEFQSTLG